MIIPIELRFKADKDSKSAFRTEKTIKSHDVNSVEFHISIEGLELTDNYTAKILSVFHSSKSQVNVDCEIVDGKIIYKPDTKLISRHEHVTNYVYVYHNNQSLDVREFIYVVDLSKIDETSLEVKEVYDQSYADLLADFEQALEDYKLTLPQADSIRADIDEILTQFNEDSQAKLSQYDTEAQQVITDNQTAFDLAESVRQESYDQTQSLINEAEQSRVQAEGQREYSESIRVQAETQRVSEESNRVSAEADRVLAEDERENAEEQRKIDHANRSAELAGKADKVVIRNALENGDFSDGVTEWVPVLGGLQEGSDTAIFTPDKNASRLTQKNDVEIGHVYYHAMRVKATGSTPNIYPTNPVSVSESIKGTGEWETVSVLHTPIRSPAETRYVYSGTIGVPIEADWIIRIDLTETFGAGNEPTKEEMDELTKVTGYIDGEYALNNKEMLGYLMKGIGEKADKKQEDWITPTLTNGWEPYDETPVSAVKFYKDEFGRVHLSGLLKYGSTANAFQFPLGYRPSQTSHFTGRTSSGTLPSTYAMPDGRFFPAATQYTGYLVLNGMNFKAEG